MNLTCRMFCGSDLSTLPQTERRVGTTVTTYRFRKGALFVEVSFTTPRIADDLDIYSRPVTLPAVSELGPREGHWCE